MAARRYEISYLQAAMQCSIYYINTNEIPNHVNLIVFWRERRDLLCSHSNGDIFTCEDNMLFLHVKISSFRAKAHPVFHSFGVYIISDSANIYCKYITLF